MTTTIPTPLLSIKHFLSIVDLEPDALQALVDFSISRKAEFGRGEVGPVLQGKVLAMVFQKASLRTRLGFETAMAQLGGHAVNLEDHQVGITKREAVQDVARVISSMCNAMMARVYKHQLIVELAASSRVPVINGLSDWSHPCQTLADVMTIQEHFGETAGRKVAFVGDGNNVARSLMNGCAQLGMRFALASPAAYQLESGEIDSAATLASRSGADVTYTSDPAEAVADADIIYTDTWTSMGQESEREERQRAFASFQVNAELLGKAKPTAMVMHCLPACRGLEITDDVVDGPQSLIFPQAENRLHGQRALLEVLLTT